jgi:hypothetical protein
LLDKEWGKKGADTTVVRFPRAMKSGPKVRRGPCAEILQFPPQLSGDELQQRFNWIRDNSNKWETEETEGVACRSEMSLRLENIVRTAAGFAPHTDADKRRKIAEGRDLIEKRNRVKDWLESLGADLDTFGQLNPAENALFFVFDRMQAGELPSIA